MYKYVLSILLAGLLLSNQTTTYGQTHPRPAPKKPTTARPYTPPATKPDLLVRRDGTRLEVLVSEITDKEIVYKRATNPNGPIFRSQKSDFNYIQYGSNGEIEQFTKVVQQVPAPEPSVQTPAPAPRPRYTSEPVYQSRSVATSEGMRFGFKGGIQSASMSGSYFSDHRMSIKGILGFQAGLVVDRPLSTNVSIRSQLLYSGKGYDAVGDDDNSVRVSYLEMPVDALYKVPTSSGQFLLGGGAYFGYALGGKSVSGNAIKIGNANNDNLISADFGLRVSAWYDLSSGLTLNAFYNLGLFNLNPTKDNYYYSYYKENGPYKNRTFGLGVGYFLSKK